MFAISPFSFIILALILPDIDTVAIEVVFNEFTFISMSAFFEHENAEAVHNFRARLFDLNIFLATCMSTRLGISVSEALDFTYVVALSFFESDFLYERFVKNSPCFPLLVIYSHILVVLSENHVQFLKIQGWTPEGTIFICKSRFVLGVFGTSDSRTIDKRDKLVRHSAQEEVGYG